LQFRSGASYSAARPDLEEFLSALDGFLHKPVSPSDPSYFKFLGTFCRSIGARDGHMLMKNKNNQLESVISFGMGKTFDADFNKAVNPNDPQDTPLMAALKQKEVMAVVDLNKETEIPSWYRKILKTNDISSMVAVPLIGKSDSLGVLCAYYHDVCLFDRGTVDHLQMIGRMVGSALEQDAGSQALSDQKEKKSFEDDFLKILLSKPHRKLELYSLAAKAGGGAVAATSVITGPIRKSVEGLSITVAAGLSVPTSAISQRILLPKFIEASLLKHGSSKIIPATKASQWGKMGSFLRGVTAYPLASPILWHGRISGALICWRVKGPGFQPSDAILLSRVAGIASLALNGKD